MNFGYILFFVVLSTPYLVGAELQSTNIRSQTADYDGEYITLKGAVWVEHAMGTLTADYARLKRDTAKLTKLEFPWIELSSNVTLTLAEGSQLECDHIFLDYTAMSAVFSGKPQVIYRDPQGDVFADHADITYAEIEGKLIPTKITLMHHIQLVNNNKVNSPSYALADEVIYYPQNQEMILRGHESRVLFYDPSKQIQLSAHTVYAHRNPETKRDAIQGVGDVRFVFGSEELEQIKTRFLH